MEGIVIANAVGNRHAGSVTLLAASIHLMPWETPADGRAD